MRIRARAHANDKRVRIMLIFSLLSSECPYKKVCRNAANGLPEFRPPNNVIKYSSLGGSVRAIGQVGCRGRSRLRAGLMFFLHPDMGSRRRAILRDKLASLGHLAVWAADKTALDNQLRTYAEPGDTSSLQGG